MRFDSAKFTEAVAVIQHELDKLKEIDDMQNAEELHGCRGLSDEECEALQAMESMLASAKIVEAVL